MFQLIYFQLSLVSQSSLSYLHVCGRSQPEEAADWCQPVAVSACHWLVFILLTFRLTVNEESYIYTAWAHDAAGTVWGSQMSCNERMRGGSSPCNNTLITDHLLTLSQSSFLFIYEKTLKSLHQNDLWYQKQEEEKWRFLLDRKLKVYHKGFFVKRLKNRAAVEMLRLNLSAEKKKESYVIFLRLKV